MTFRLSSSEQYRLSEVLRAIMETLCPKLLDAVLAHLAVGDYHFSARFAVQDLFVAVLEETPFRWYDYQMPRLMQAFRSRYGSRISTLSLCGMNFSPLSYDTNIVLGFGHLVIPARVQEPAESNAKGSICELRTAD